MPRNKPLLLGEGDERDNTPRRLTAAFDQYIDVGDPKRIAERIMDLALHGNGPLTALALKLVVDRLWPALRAVETTLTHDAISNSEFTEAKKAAAKLDTATLREIKKMQKTLVDGSTTKQ